MTTDTYEQSFRACDRALAEIEAANATIARHRAAIGEHEHAIRMDAEWSRCPHHRKNVLDALAVARTSLALASSLAATARGLAEGRKDDLTAHSAIRATAARQLEEFDEFRRQLGTDPGRPAA